MTTLTITNSIDELGALLAEISALTKRADAIKDAIKETASMGGDKVVEGDLFKATYTETNRSNVDWKKLSVALGIGSEVIAKYTGTTAVYSVKVTSK
jgi:hypothetical protein